MKKKMVKKFASLLLVGVIGAGLAAGCTGDETRETVKSGTNGKITEEPLELSIFMIEDDTFNEDWRIFSVAAEKTNIHLKGTLSQSASDGQQAFNLMMSSKNLADIIKMDGKDIFWDYGKQGAFVDLAPLIEEHAPNIKKFLDENPDTKKYMTTEDGKIYYIPLIPDGEAAKGWFIRKDWLDKLNLPMPQTIEEVYQTMKAFKTQDPNGNGIADEIPYFNRDAGVNYEASISDLLSMFYANQSFAVRDGKIVYGPLEDQYRNAYETISKWYSEGLIDQEIYTRGSKARDTLLAEDKGGITIDWFQSTADTNSKLSESIPGYAFVPMAPPQATNGKKQLFSVRDVNGSESGWGISSTCKYPVEAIKYFDFWFTEEGRRLANFGIEGEHYTMVDGKPVFTDAVLHGDKLALDILRSVGAQRGIGYKQDFDYEQQCMNDIAKEGVKMYLDNGYCVQNMPPINLTSEQERQRKQIMGSIETYVREFNQSWVLGDKNVAETFEEFKTTIKNMGIDEAIKITQEAYDKYMSE